MNARPVEKCQRAVQQYDGRRWRGTRTWRGNGSTNGEKAGVLRDGQMRLDGVRDRRCTPFPSTAPARYVLSYHLLLLLLCGVASTSPPRACGLACACPFVFSICYLRSRSCTSSASTHRVQQYAALCSLAHNRLISNLPCGALKGGPRRRALR